MTYIASVIYWQMSQLPTNFAALTETANNGSPTNNQHLS